MIETVRPVGILAGDGPFDDIAGGMALLLEPHFAAVDDLAAVRARHNLARGITEHVAVIGDDRVPDRVPRAPPRRPGPLPPAPAGFDRSRSSSPPPLGEKHNLSSRLVHPVRSAPAQALTRRRPVPGQAFVNSVPPSTGAAWPGRPREYYAPATDCRQSGCAFLCIQRDRKGCGEDQYPSIEY